MAPYENWSIGIIATEQVLSVDSGHASLPSKLGAGQTCEPASERGWPEAWRFGALS